MQGDREAFWVREKRKKEKGESPFLPSNQIKRKQAEGWFIVPVEDLTATLLISIDLCAINLSEENEERRRKMVSVFTTCLGRIRPWEVRWGVSSVNVLGQICSRVGHRLTLSPPLSLSFFFKSQFPYSWCAAEWSGHMWIHERVWGIAKAPCKQKQDIEQWHICLELNLREESD